MNTLKEEVIVSEDEVGNKKVVLFTGAGCSHAVFPDMFPTTKGFIDLLEEDEEIIGSRYYRMVLDNIGGKEQADIEQIILELQKMQKQIVQLTTEDVSGSSIENNYLYQLITQPPELSDYNLDVPNGFRYENIITRLLNEIGSRVAELNTRGGTWDTFKGEIQDLIHQINSKLHDVYGEHPYPEDEYSYPSNELLNLLHSLVRYKNFKIFTTNYDTTIERSLDYLRKIDENFKRVHQCLKGNVLHQEFSHQRLYVKLHGSIDMVSYRNGICVQPSPEFVNYEKQYIAYPEEIQRDGEQISLPYKEPQIEKAINNNFRFFEDAISEADHIVFIGFSFRASHINEILNRLLKDQKVLVITKTDEGTDEYNRINNLFSKLEEENFMFRTDGFSEGVSSGGIVAWINSLW